MRRDGFSVLAVMAAVAMVAVLAAVFTPMAVRQSEWSRHRVTLQRMETILTGMIGADVLVSHGYLGDMGVLPPDIQSLIVQGAQPAFTQAANGIGTGWNGPYVRHLGPISALSEDLWSMPFSYDGVAPQLTSSGPDRQLGTVDDIVWPATSEATTGDLQVTVLGVSGGGPPVTLDPSDVFEVEVSYSDEGDPTTRTLTWNGSNFVRSAIHRGVHAVTAVGKGAYAGTSSSVVLVVHSGLNRLNLALEEPEGESGSGSGSGSGS